MTERMDRSSVPIDIPFLPPADIVLELPSPVSVNRSRRIDWKGHKKVQDWVKVADQFLLVAKAAKQVRCERLARYELHITLSEDHVNVDADNALKIVIDYLRHRDITADDSKKNLRKLTVEWGFAAAGVIVVIKPLGAA